MLNETDLSRVDLNLLTLFETVMKERHVGRAAPIARHLRLNRIRNRRVGDALDGQLLAFVTGRFERLPNFDL